MKKAYLLIFLGIMAYFIVNKTGHFEQFNTHDGVLKPVKSKQELQKEYETNLVTIFERDSLGRLGNACTGLKFFKTHNVYRDLKAFTISAKKIIHWDHYYFDNKSKLLRIEVSDLRDGTQQRVMSLFNISKKGQLVSQALSSDESINPSKQVMDKYLNKPDIIKGRHNTYLNSSTELDLEVLDDRIIQFSLKSSRSTYFCELASKPKCQCRPNG